MSKSSSKVTDKSRLASFFSDNKDDILNHLGEIDYKVSSGSLIFDSETRGGIGPGVIRFAGPYESGKTSCVLNFMANFLADDSLPFRKKGIFIKSEGRLSETIQDRYPFKFVSMPEDWEDGTCITVASNKFETVFSLLKEIVVNNPEDIKYFIVIDSMDCLITKDDALKSFDQATKVAGGAVLTSAFLKQLALDIKIRGHIFVAISQIRAEIKLNPYSSTPPKDNFSGGNALLHAADWIFELKSVSKSNRIADDSKLAVTKGFDGHYVTVKIHKSTNETTDKEFSYPIKYGVKNSNAVWHSRELSEELFIQWGLVKKAGAWFKPSDFFKTELKDKCQIDVPEQIQGSDALLTFVESNPCLVDYGKDKLKMLINP